MGRVSRSSHRYRYYAMMIGTFLAILLIQTTQTLKLCNAHLNAYLERYQKAQTTHGENIEDMVNSEGNISTESFVDIYSNGTLPLINKNISTTNGHSSFHFIFTTAPETLNWRFVKAIEAVFFHHPRAKVTIHSKTLPTNTNSTLLGNFTRANYDLEVKPYSFEELLEHSEYVKHTDMVDFMKILEKRRSSKFWYSHETDLIRLLLLELNGGVYLDTDIHLIKPIPLDYKNVLGFQGRGGDKVNGAVMIFDKHNQFVRDCLQDAISIAIHSYIQRDWEIFGPRLLTRHFEERRNETETVRVVPMDTFYPYPIYRTKQCFITPKEEFNPIHDERTIAVHLNTGLTKEYNYTMEGTACEEIFRSNCIFCSDESYHRRPLTTKEVSQ